MARFLGAPDGAVFIKGGPHMSFAVSGGFIRHISRRHLGLCYLGQCYLGQCATALFVAALVPCFLFLQSAVISQAQAAPKMKDGISAQAAEKTLLSRSPNGIGLSLASDGTSSTTLSIETGKSAPKYEVTRLESPARLVVDVYNTKADSNRTFKTSESSEVSTVRLGAHPDKSRIVLDLNEASPPMEEVSVQGSKIIVALGGTGAPKARPDTAKLPAVAEREVPSSDLPSSDSQVAEVSPNQAGIEPLFREDTFAASPEKKSAAATTVTGVEIERAPRAGNMVVAKVSQFDGGIDFQKTAPSEYVLTIKGAALDPSLGTTIVSPPGNGSIRSVRPVAKGSDVVLRIFAQPEASLDAKWEGSSVFVTDNSNFDDTQDMRAQAETGAHAGANGGVVTGTDAAKPATNGGGAAAADTSVAKPANGTTNGEGTASGEEKKDTTAANPGGTIDNSDLAALLGGDNKYSGRLISLDLQDTDIDNALRIIAEVSNLNIIASDDVTGKVTLRLIDVPWDQALDVILKTNGLDKVQEGNVVRIAPVERLRQERESLKQAQQAEEELEPVQVRYIRISYARASAIKPILDTVVTERGSVAYDERTNQIIVKDIKKGLKNVTELIRKLDLRTPQVLLETQIVEANRTLLRDLGTELGFTYVASPATGNATGYNFPNSIDIGGSIGGPNGPVTSFPASDVAVGSGSAISMLFDSADGSRSLSTRITALEREGRVRIISRPAVATTNNTQAAIESTETIRVKKPDGGLSVATGQGASNSGSGESATESIKAGIRLTVTPQASPDYFVLLDIEAESSSFNFGRVVEGIPSSIVRKANSTVLVSSGQTFAMGGIYKIRDDDSVRGVPFFKDIPFIGHLFRGVKTDNSDEELLFFITPRIVEGSFDDAAMKLSAS